MERTQEKTVAENHEGESVKGLSKWEVEARRLAGESASIEENIKEGGYSEAELNEFALNVAHLKEEQAKYLLRIHDAMEKIDEKETHNQSALELRNEVKGMEGYIEGLKREIAAEEKKLTPESAEKIVWLELPSKMTLEEANEWIATENAKNPGQKYELASIEELEEAYAKQIDHFQKELYLSGTPDENLKGNALGLNFETGERETIVRTQAVAVKCKTIEVKE